MPSNQPEGERREGEGGRTHSVRGGGRGGGDTCGWYYRAGRGNMESRAKAAIFSYASL